MAKRPPFAALMATPDEIEAQFYEALQTADLERLMALWINDELVRCIHPGGPLLVGATAIRASFAQLFERGPIQVQVVDVQRLATEQLCIHQVRERVVAGTRTAWVQATNAYLKTEQGWRLVLHHASPGQAAPTSEAVAPPGVLH
jgi:ketosteroid isomerase-like protein